MRSKDNAILEYKDENGISRGRRAMISIDDFDEFDWEDENPTRCYIKERKTDQRNPINIDKIIFFVNGKPIEFIKTK